MQSEFTASAVAWGFSTFSKNKCSVKAITSPNVTAETVYRIEKEKKDDADEQIIISRGTLFEIGLEFSPNSSFVGSLDEFIASFEKHKQLLNFNLQVQLGCGQAVHRETSDIQKRANQHGDPDKMNCTVFCQRPNGFYIGDASCCLFQSNPGPHNACFDSLQVHGLRFSSHSSMWTYLFSCNSPPL